ncbi:hypothetical protein Gbem_4089 [Citrifermentans bemidjiense Bem]|uniref:Uncharacterized protein n=1 Tax=Citrifermentans bemidjiense (strain ATCC BAA-1014 / DSM 16622 / JCM 12645 / Bem) TaxID=404380 RepID=E1P695_CITBB|nr:hypothetical protein Gbem_4089 [Citrifermentans bemidjiense Bem]
MRKVLKFSSAMPITNSSGIFPPNNATAFESAVNLRYKTTKATLSRTKPLRIIKNNLVAHFNFYHVISTNYSLPDPQFSSLTIIFCFRTLFIFIVHLQIM